MPDLHKLYESMRADAVDATLARDPGSAIVHFADGRKFAPTGRLEQLPLPPTPTALNLSSLQALVDYLGSPLGAAEAETTSDVVHVVSPSQVCVVSELDDYSRRRTLLQAIVPRVSVPEQGWPLAGGRATVAIHTTFDESPHRELVSNAVARVRSDRFIQTEDDGVTQRVHAGIGAHGDWEELPRPCTLRPYWTFRELPQPEVQWLVRIEGEDEKLRLVLHDMDHGRWEVAARAAVATWLSERLDGWTVLY